MLKILIGITIVQNGIKRRKNEMDNINTTINRIYNNIPRCSNDVSFRALGYRINMYCNRMLRNFKIN